MINPLYFIFKLKNPEIKLLENNVSFYVKLSEKDKKKFEFRVARFIKNHDFIGRENIIITPAIKVITSSIAIMLTFKMYNYLFLHFENIIIYPKDYLSLSTNKFHKGETNPMAKSIVFSWKGLVDGIKIEDDNLNLGIHEFTHALFFNFLKKKSFEGNRFIRYHKRILIFLKDKKEQKRVVDTNYFREYAFENQHEFLAVITENYFETPNEFKNKLPELFKLLNKMYKIY